MSDTPRTDAFRNDHHLTWPGWAWMDHASEYLDFARKLERENARLAAQNAAQFTQITDLLGVLADITEAAAESGTDSHNLREQISRYVAGMGIKAGLNRAETTPSP